MKWNPPHTLTKEVHNIVEELKAGPDLVCPVCGEKLEEIPGEYEGQTYEGVRCPNGCELR